MVYRHPFSSIQHPLNFERSRYVYLKCCFPHSWPENLQQQHWPETPPATGRSLSVGRTFATPKGQSANPIAALKTILVSVVTTTYVLLLLLMTEILLRLIVAYSCLIWSCLSSQLGDLYIRGVTEFQPLGWLHLFLSPRWIPRFHSLHILVGEIPRNKLPVTKVSLYLSVKYSRFSMSKLGRKLRC